jgi:hypothetical protein
MNLGSIGWPFLPAGGYLDIGFSERASDRKGNSLGGTGESRRSAVCRAQGFSPEAVPSKLARKKDGGRTGQLDSSEFGVERMTTNCRARIDDVQLGDALKGRVTGVAERL